MALPAWARTAGIGLQGVAEGLQNIPALQDKDEEIAYRRAERPLDLEEAQLRVRKTREDLEKPKIQVLGQNSYAIAKPDGTVEIRTLGGQAPKIQSLGNGRYTLTYPDGHVEECDFSHNMANFSGITWQCPYVVPCGEAPRLGPLSRIMWQ